MSDMPFADLALSRRLEHAESFAGSEFARSRLRVSPDCGSIVQEHSGTIMIFDGIDSPVTQTFRLGLHEPLTQPGLDVIEKFFTDRGARPVHEVSPFAGLGTLQMLCSRGYLPFEISSVMYREAKTVEEAETPSIRVRSILPGEEKLWSSISAKGWAQDNMALADSIKSFGGVIAASPNCQCFLAEIEGRVAAAGVMFVDQGVALFGGSATLPAYRKRGLQGALLKERMRQAVKQGCDLVMMVAEAGSNSQRNAERRGFRVAYTRLKWRLEAKLE